MAINKYGQRTGSPLKGDDLDNIGNESNDGMFTAGLIVLAVIIFGLIIHFS